MPALLLENVRKAYGAKVAVDGIGFEVREGEVFGLLGPNGAGKSTLIRMAMDILRPDAGSIRILGRPSTAAESDRIGYLPEERGLYRKQKVLDVLDYFGRLKGMRGPDVRREAAEWLARLGLAEWGKKKVQELSKGMQQKVQIAATFMHRPQILVLDEPFSGLDPVNTVLIKDLIREVHREGRTVVLSTHQMDQVEELCDRIAMIDRGKLVLYGELDEIKRRFAKALHREAPEGTLLVLEGEDGIERLSGIRTAERRNRAWSVRLEPGLAPERFLASVVASGLTLDRYEVAPVPLEEIFVHVVREGAETAA
jgi:ABC-2 type transport system ATP-binding protein